MKMTRNREKKKSIKRKKREEMGKRRKNMFRKV